MFPNVRRSNNLKMTSPQLAQASFACAFLISSNIYQHKRGRLRYSYKARVSGDARHQCTLDNI
jgi:lipoprotein